MLLQLDCRVIIMAIMGVGLAEAPNREVNMENTRLAEGEVRSTSFQAAEVRSTYMPTSNIPIACLPVCLLLLRMYRVVGLSCCRRLLPVSFLPAGLFF